MGDKIRLKQVLINLTQNALKSTINGQITIKTAYNYELKRLEVHIVDTGKGLNEVRKK